jgi:hypothetical protein
LPPELKTLHIKEITTTQFKKNTTTLLRYIHSSLREYITKLQLKYHRKKNNVITKKNIFDEQKKLLFHAFILAYYVHTHISTHTNIHILSTIFFKLSNIEGKISLKQKSEKQKYLKIATSLRL